MVGEAEWRFCLERAKAQEALSLQMPLASPKFPKNRLDRQDLA